jgi:hypothetical protein
MNSGKGLGPWALALGGAWALALAWVFIGVGCQSMWLLFLCSASLRLPSQPLVPTQQHGCHPPPHTCSALYVMLLGAHCLGGLGSCVGEGVGARRAVGASSAPPPSSAQPMSALLPSFVPFLVPSATWKRCPCNCEESGRWVVCGERGWGQGQVWVGCFRWGFPLHPPPTNPAHALPRLPQSTPVVPVSLSRNLHFILTWWRPFP